jgi:hypothetical protein
LFRIRCQRMERQKLTWFFLLIKVLTLRKLRFNNWSHSVYVVWSLYLGSFRRNLLALLGLLLCDKLLKRLRSQTGLCKTKIRRFNFRSEITLIQKSAVWAKWFSKIKADLWYLSTVHLCSYSKLSFTNYWFIYLFGGRIIDLNKRNKRFLRLLSEGYFGFIDFLMSLNSCWLSRTWVFFYVFSALVFVGLI